MNSIGSQFKSIRILSVLGAREWIRLKFFYLVIFISLIFIAFSHLLSALTFAVQERLLFDFGLGGLEIGLIFISCMIGSHAIQREIDRKTLFVLLVRPLPRWHIVLGSWGTLFILNFIFAFGFSFTLIASSGSFRLIEGFAVATVSCLLKAFVMSSFALAMGVIVRPILALGMGISYWILCYSIPDLLFFIKKLDKPALLQFVESLDKVIPRFYLFNWKSYQNILQPPSWADFDWALTHCMAWTLLWLFVAAYFFKRKEIV